MPSSSSEAALPPRGRLLGFLQAHSIRAKLIVAFGGLLLLGLLNIVVYYWGASERSKAFAALQGAIERQVLITDAFDRLEDQQKYFDLLPLLGEGAISTPLDETERRSFSEGIDSIAVLLQDMLARTEPDREVVVAALLAKTQQLGVAWKQFFEAQGLDSAQAFETLYVRAEPLASELLARDFPAAARYEEQTLTRLSEQFIETDRFFERLAWTSFILSALLGGVLALLIARNLLFAIAALATGADRIGAGQLDHRIALPNRDELGDVAASFNSMAARLEERTDQLAAQRDDLTRALEELKTTQTQLVQKEKMASLGQLTAGIAHEIKNPLNFVNNFAALSTELVDELREELEAHPEKTVGELSQTLAALTDDLRANAEKIQDHGERADGIVRAMLEHARDRPGERRTVDLNALVDEYAKLAFHGVRAQVPDFSGTLATEYGAEVGEIEVEPQELGRVFVNLLNNAFHAIHERTRHEDDGYVPEVRIETKRRGRWAEIKVADNGTGIRNDVRAKIFEPFFTTKPSGEGTGLGLSLSYDIVTQRHGGRLRVESEEGQGTAFTVVLPVS